MAQKKFKKPKYKIGDIVVYKNSNEYSRNKFIQMKIGLSSYYDDGWLYGQHLPRNANYWINLECREEDIITKLN